METHSDFFSGLLCPPPPKSLSAVLSALGKKNSTSRIACSMDSLDTTAFRTRSA